MTKLTLLAVLIFAAGFFSQNVSGAVFVVVNSNPSGPGSLAQAIDDANSETGPHEIVFAIPGPGVHKIDLGGSGGLPALMQPITIDGYTQPGAQPNTLSVGSNAVILIQIEGGGPSSRARLGFFLTNSCTVRGLSLTGFSRPLTGAAISIDPGDTFIIFSGNRVEGCFIGTRA